MVPYSTILSAECSSVRYSAKPYRNVQYITYGVQQQYSIIPYSIVPHCTIQYSIAFLLQYDAIPSNKVQCNTITTFQTQYQTEPDGTAPTSAVRYRTVQCSRAQYLHNSIVTYHTVQYTIQCTVQCKTQYSAIPDVATTTPTMTPYATSFSR